MPNESVWAIILRIVRLKIHMNMIRTECRAMHDIIRFPVEEVEKDETQSRDHGDGSNDFSRP